MLAKHCGDSIAVRLPYLTLARLTLIYPLIATSNNYMVKFLMMTRLFWITLRTAYITAAASSPRRTIALDFLARNDATRTRTMRTWFIAWTYPCTIFNLDLFKHTTY